MRKTRFDTVVKVRVPVSLAEALERAADRNCESVSALVRAAVLAELAIRHIRIQGAAHAG
jgi:hypothetical protein